MYKTNTTVHQRFRLLLSGFPNTGKTSSLQTFIYGPYDYDTEQQEALEYAAQRHMVIINCPGEFGTRSLPRDSECVTSYFTETDETGLAYSVEALADFSALYKEIVKQRPEVLAIDGLHALWDHIMNKVTGGDYFEGKALNINAQGRVDGYQSARYHSQAHNTFHQMLAELYNCPIPLVVATTWEEWEGSVTEESHDQAGKVVAIESKRYLWPSIPGKMAKGVVGRFDARLSARLERRCMHTACQESKEGKEHFVWQFLSKGDVRGVGIKGLNVGRLNAHVRQHPYMHQRWDTLKAVANVQ